MTLIKSNWRDQTSHGNEIKNYFALGTYYFWSGDSLLYLFAVFPAYLVSIRGQIYNHSGDHCVGNLDLEV